MIEDLVRAVVERVSKMNYNGSARKTVDREFGPAFSLANMIDMGWVRPEGITPAGAAQIEKLAKHLGVGDIT